MTRNWKSFYLYTSPEPLGLTKTKDGLCGREWVAFGSIHCSKVTFNFFANVCIVHFQSNAVILFYWQIPNKRHTWRLKREPVSPTLPGWKKLNNTDSQYVTKALEMMLNTTYLAILRSVTFSVVLGAEFTVSTCWVWFYKRTIKFEKFPTVSAESLNMSLYYCLFRALSAPGSICALLFSQVERSNMVVQLYRTPNSSPKPKIGLT